MVLAAAAAALALSACEPDDDPIGDVQVVYRVGSGTSTCEDLGIEDVRIGLMTSATSSTVDQSLPCAPGDQTVLLSDVPAGDHTLRVEGLDDAAQPTHSGEAGSDVEAGADQTSGPFTVVLDQIRPSMVVWCGVSEVGGCDRFEVVDVRVALHEKGASQVYDQTCDCVELATGAGRAAGRTE